MSVKTEKELIALAKAGDERSFELLIEQCKTKAYNIALRYLRNEEDAMDALQESFIKIYRHLESFREGSKFDTWVYRIVVNTCNDMLRKNHGAPVEYLNRSDEEEEEYTLELPDTDPGPQDALLQKEQAKLILDALDQLKPDQKEVVILRDIQGFAYEEIAEMLNCSMGTIKSRINRSRSRLREILLEQNGDFFRLTNEK
ncbi:MAG: sigma-70 family RNA polymerase sigma factor [Firmicutes bacterium]|nr:sigma-70 family RNA polymerase sigma factor [Bacillota bacterium]MBQ6686737.1 sigma-70 family RNA polymerase sigma factor [Bacillota bacterium]